MHMLIKYVFGTNVSKPIFKRNSHVENRRDIRRYDMTLLSQINNHHHRHDNDAISRKKNITYADLVLFKSSRIFHIH